MERRDAIELVTPYAGALSRVWATAQARVAASARAAAPSRDALEASDHATVDGLEAWLQIVREMDSVAGTTRGVEVADYRPQGQSIPSWTLADSSGVPRARLLVKRDVARIPADPSGDRGGQMFFGDDMVVREHVSLPRLVLAHDVHNLVRHNPRIEFKPRSCDRPWDSPITLSSLITMPATVAITPERRNSDVDVRSAASVRLRRPDR